MKPGETIPSIAAFYECLPGEVKELNRLQFKKTILPGQVLRVLDRRSAPEQTQLQGQVTVWSDEKWPVLLKPFCLMTWKELSECQQRV